MKHPILVNPDTGKGSIMDTLSADVRRMNLCVNEIGIASGGRQGDIDHMLFNVTFLNERGEGGSAMWLTGNLFHSVITHSLKKIKYVYDNTVNPKPHWVSVELVYEQNVTSLSQRME